MFVLHMEHPVANYDAWKQRGFDADPLGRKQMGVTRYRIGRKTGDPNHVMPRVCGTYTGRLRRAGG